jgi:hypothetical protein
MIFLSVKVKKAIETSKGIRVANDNHKWYSNSINNQQKVLINLSIYYFVKSNVVFGRNVKFQSPITSFVSVSIFWTVIGILILSLLQAGQ